jgi:hypothetical protein
MVDLAEIQAAYYMVAATGVLVAAIYYVYNMRISQKNSMLALKAQEQTLETRQAQLLMNIFQTYSSKEFQTDMEEMLHTWKWKDYDDYMSKYGIENVVENGKHATVFRIYDGTGVFVRRGLVNPELVYDLMRESVILTWEKFLPIVESWRSRYNAPQIYLNFEYLYHEMKKVREERGYPATSFGRITP